jgi:hypothetical protein
MQMRSKKGIFTVAEEDWVALFVGFDAHPVSGHHIGAVEPWSDAPEALFKCVGV